MRRMFLGILFAWHFAGAQLPFPPRLILKEQNTDQGSTYWAQRRADSLATVEAVMVPADEGESRTLTIQELDIITAEDNFLEAKYTEAKSGFQALADDYELPYFWFMVAMCDFKTGDLKSAIVPITKCIDGFAKEPVINDDDKIENKKARMKESFESPSINENGVYVGYTTSKGFIIYTMNRLGYEKNLAHLIRAICKSDVGDNYGVISDLRLYHKFRKDSTTYSNGLMGFALLRIGKLKESKKYFDAAILKAKNSDNKSDLADVYYFRGEYFYKTKQYENACLDWSKAGEYGHSDAYEKINEYCK